MLKKWLGLFFIVFGVVAVSLGSYAQVKIHMSSYLVQVDKKTGKETLVTSNTAYPGAVIQYVIDATNTTDKAIQGLVLVGPIPAPTKLLPAWYQAILNFLAGKAEAPAFCVLIKQGAAAQTVPMTGHKLPEFSIDGGKTYSRPPVSYVVNGKTKQATPDMFTHIRWTIDTLGPGEKVEISYRVVVP